MTPQDMNNTRCIKPKNFGEIIHCSRHSFYDACGTDYDLSAYIRLVNAGGVVHCSLLLEKSRVTPQSQVHIHFST